MAIRRGAESERSLDSSQQNQWKKAAAEAAAKLVEDGMIVGLGTGSTSTYFVNALAKRVAHEHLHISGIPTSQKTAALARSLKIPLSTFAAHTQIDLTVDGADEVERGTLYLIKGHGGALLREKIVAAASKRMAIVVDETKLVDRLGSLFAVPVETVKFGWQATQQKLQALGANRRGGSARIRRSTSPTAGTTLWTVRSARWRSRRKSRTTWTTWSARSSTGFFSDSRRKFSSAAAIGVKILKPS